MVNDKIERAFSEIWARVFSEKQSPVQALFSDLSREYVIHWFTAGYLAGQRDYLEEELERGLEKNHRG